MTTNSVIISSSGLKNVVLSKYQEEDEFIFVFGEEKFRMKNLFAEFISPVVSYLHQTDPTISTINFCEMFGMKSDYYNKISKALITSETTTHLQQISSGYSIEINEEKAIKLRLISILLGNDELHQKLNELFPTNYSEENINTYMKNLKCLYDFSQVNETIDFSKCISFIASHFYMIDEEEFWKTSHEIQYLIISHSEMQIESEDRLFDIISQIIESDKDDKEEISNISFLEQIDVNGRFPQEIRDFQEEYQLSPESVDYFFQLLNKSFNIEEDLILTYIQCIDLLKISKHLKVRKLFYNINQYIKSHNIDVDFAIQVVEYEIKKRKETNNYDIENSKEVESSLIGKINECFTNEKFKNLSYYLSSYRTMFT